MSDPEYASSRVVEAELSEIEVFAMLAISNVFTVAATINGSDPLSDAWGTAAREAVTAVTPIIVQQEREQVAVEIGNRKVDLSGFDSVRQGDLASRAYALGWYDANKSAARIARGGGQ